jgi:hypothetical protein
MGCAGTGALHCLWLLVGTERTAMNDKSFAIALNAIGFASDGYTRLAKMIYDQMESGQVHDPLKLLKFISEINRRLAADVVTMRRLFEEEEP